MFYNALPKNALILSPMVGFSDSPYREICRKMGAAYSITEFVSAQHLTTKSKNKIPSVFKFGKMERPIVFQVFGNDAETIINGVKKILPLNPDGIDLNMGCSVRKVAHHGSGAALMREPQKVKEIISGLVKVSSVPISAKMRLGWDHGQMNFKEIGKIVQEEGGSAVAIHARTKQMKYSGVANWDLIGELAAHLSIPVFGNGDIRKKATALNMIETYGLQGVFIGKGALGNPWIFENDQKRQLSLEARMPVILRHLRQMHRFYAEKAAILFRKHFTQYTEDIHIEKDIRQEILSLTNTDEFIKRIQTLCHI